MEKFITNETDNDLTWLSVLLSLKKNSTPCSYLLLTKTDYQAYEVSRFIKQFSNEEELLCYLFPSLETIISLQVEPDPQVLSLRRKTQYELLKNSSVNKNKILVTSVSAFNQKIVSAKNFKNRLLELKLNESLSKSSLINYLESSGFNRKLEVSTVGEYSDHGSLSNGVVDVFSPLFEDPRRLEFYNDKLISIRVLSTESQRSSGSHDNFNICSVKEFSRQIFSNIQTDKEEILKRIEKFKKVSEKLDLSSTDIKFYEEAIREDSFPIGYETIYSELEDELVSIDSYLGHVTEAPEFLPKISRVVDFRVVRDFKNKLDNSSREIASYLQVLLKKYKSVIISLSSANKTKILVDLLTSSNINFKERYVSLLEACTSLESGITLVNSDSPESFYLSDSGLVVLNEKILFGTVTNLKKRKYPYKKSSFRSSLGSLKQLNTDDYVVHDQYGIGKFLGLTKKNITSATQNEYLEIEYADNNKLYVPIYDFLKVGKYSGPDGATPMLTRLGGGQWDLVRAKIKNDIAQVTSSLLKTLAVRSVVKGISFGPYNTDDEWFSEQFGYEETLDQRKAIEDVLSDMSSDKPMDRLVCGDVGFGKTEVALRAAFKAVSFGKQVAILVPTTILAEQHGKTFLSRFSETPYRIEVLNRFVNKKEVKTILADISNGKIDIVIGTHRIIQSDVIFKDLGLVIVDEEHRFGVSQKEKLKKLRSEVDVLSLSATPIPRTLQMALFGTRDLSVIETAPLDRLPIKTTALKFDTSEYIRVIEREIERGGQVYVVHHFINDLSRLSDLISQFLPTARISIIHGKIPKNQLEKIMEDFYDGKIDVLIATHIIESGLDIPNANTMVIVDPQLFGLAQLYQLRGRVGRSDIQAYCYLMYKDSSSLTNDSKRRLDALTSSDELGVGFKLALQDLEIRGAGAFLGKNQSGHVQAVGYEMYLKILEEAVKVEKQKRSNDFSNKNLEADILIFDTDLQIGIYPVIPEEYIPDSTERMIYYQKSGYIKTIEDRDSLKEELKDRFGAYPTEVEELLQFMLLRGLANSLGIHKVTRQDSSFIFSFIRKDSYIDFSNRNKSKHYESKHFEFSEKDLKVRLLFNKEDYPSTLEIMELLLNQILFNL